MKKKFILMLAFLVYKRQCKERKKDDSSYK